MQQAVGVGLGHQVVHQVQAGVAADEDLLRLRAEELGEQPLGRRDAGQLAVVADVQSVVDAVGRIGQNGQQVADHVELLAAGLAARHVERKLLRLIVGVARLQRGVFGAALLKRQGLIGLHIGPLLRKLSDI